MKAIIIEDEPLIAEDIRMHIEKMHITCTDICDTMEQAIGSAEENRPDFALVDINLNGRHLGIEIARELRFQFGIQIIFITSYSQDSIVEEAEEINPVDYLVKPFSIKQLEVSIKRVALRNPDNHFQQIDISVYNAALVMPLTQAEFLIWKELASGKTNKDISESLGLSENTIKTHLKTLFVKLDCTQRSKAVEQFYKISNRL